jgi:hypothetical protein
MTAADVIVLLTMLKNWWINHGTKILGTVSIIVAGLLAKDSLIDAGTFRDVVEVLDIVLGALVVQRGFTNGKKSASG